MTDKTLIDNIFAVKRAITKKKNELRAIKVQKLFVSKREEMKSLRLNHLSISNANRFAILGDEFKLRQELELGHDINERDHTTGRTVLHDAVGGGHFYLVRMLCSEFKANVNIPTFLGKSYPLHIAVENNFRQIASVLITYGANVNAINGQGQSPYHLVRSIHVLKLLLKFDVDALIKCIKGLTPLNYYLTVTPEDAQHKQMIDLMTSREDSRNIELVRIKLQNQKAIRDLELAKLALVTSGNSTVLTESSPTSKKKKSPQSKSK